MKSDQFQIVPKKMTEEEESDLYIALALVALKGEHRKFEFIRCWQHHKIVRLYKKALKTIIKRFKDLKALNEKLIRAGHGTISSLVLCSQFSICVKFYKKELHTINDMLSEYREYVCSGHLLDTFVLPRLRTEDELVDYRTLPGVWIFKKPY